MDDLVNGLMYRVVCTTSLVFSVTPLERGPLHTDKAKVMKMADWLRARGHDALVQESPTGKCFDHRGTHVGTSPMSVRRDGGTSFGLSK